jgi:hypothetical protein
MLERGTEARAEIPLQPFVQFSAWCKTALGMCSTSVRAVNWESGSRIIHDGIAGSAVVQQEVSGFVFAQCQAINSPRATG